MTQTQRPTEVSSLNEPGPLHHSSPALFHEKTQLLNKFKKERATLEEQYRNALEKLEKEHIDDMTRLEQFASAMAKTQRLEAENERLHNALTKAQQLEEDNEHLRRALEQRAPEQSGGESVRAAYTTN